MKNHRKLFVSWLILLGIWNLIFMFPQWGPFIHESDQASLLEGALRLSQSGEVDQNFYNYDKQFGTYWILATAFRPLRENLSPQQVVALANSTSLIAINLAFIILGLLLTDLLSFIGLAAILLAPCFLAHAPFVAGNYFATAFLALEILTLAKTRSWLQPALCAFAATACRADAILVQPIIVWSFSTDQTFVGLLKSRTSWACATGAISAIVTGILISSGEASGGQSWNPSFKSKIWAAYVAFGLGGAGILIAIGCLALSYPHRERPRFLYNIWGLLALLGPFVYYSLHLYSTRYWTIPLFGLAAFVLGRNGLTLLQGLVKQRLWKVFFFVLLPISVILPCFAGVRLPVLNHPSLTFTKPSLFPSADGLLPMGAYIARAWGWDKSERSTPDHNQAVWLAALQCSFEPFQKGPVLLFNSPLVSILQLAAYLKGVEYEILSTIPTSIIQPIYTEARFLRKMPVEGTRKITNNPLDHHSEPFSFGIEYVSPEIDGESIVRLVGTPNPLAKEMELFRAQMGGNDFLLYRVEEDDTNRFFNQMDLFGRKVTILSQTQFTLKQDHHQMKSHQMDLGNGQVWHVLSTSIISTRPIAFEGNDITVAIAVLPNYMNILSY